MPRLKPNPTEESSRVVRACISHNIDLYCLEENYVAAKMGVVPRTLHNKRERPETFTLGELWKVSQTLKLTPIQAASIVLGRPLTSKEVKEFIMM